MKSSMLIKAVLLFFLVVSLFAPFTFLKPKVVEQTIDEPLAKVIKNKPIKKIIKKEIEKPLHKVKLPDFASILDIQTKKKKFFDFIKPAVMKQNNKLLETRSKLNAWLEHVSLEIPLSKQEQQELKQLVKKYRVNKNASILSQLNALLLRVDVIPMPLVLVQAANESAWGTSRFSRIGLNFFGIWCYQEGCGMVPNSRDTGANHEVAAFQSLDEAVAHYFDNINSHNAYRVFRTIRYELRSQEQELNPEVLAVGLLPYSERGVDYVIDITKMLRQNEHFLMKQEKDALSAEVIEG